MVATSKKEQESMVNYDEIVQTYLDKQYRPFSVNDIVNNLSKEITKKTIVIKSLESLVKQNRIVVKNFGKIQIYCCLDKELSSDIDLKLYNLTKLTELRTELIEIDKKKSIVSETWNNLEKELSNNEIIDYNKNKLQEIESLEFKIHNIKQLQENSNIDQVKINKIIDLNDKIEKDYKKRVKNMKDLMLLLKDVTQSKNIEDLLENIGVEKL
ncbi:hypothetical protein TPHA_0F00540 [Tetrapisispora phaffii CBS 4417]|uniref:Homologous-pairing protein 2 winged helix domain-containing protein n=1 Tax=Tetrapisispora phaffii (strain ATCC 24235 / CBS 4417 / NBRC 1672 / NRRL Y-8282 / UCD 70-5) TaxID=1071381 RepID=G8BUV9_TETPH|nr:hypothetical protein TPHA_0F00540 [Tetrapisispora phaffii CBS 4417]CCE63541.1 hypothetical protein TPHA_0F00540 [Tetrapisispora phaffii CBS 4417]